MTRDSPRTQTSRPRVLWWHRVVGLVELDVAVAMHLAPRFGEARKQRGGQRQQRRALRGEQHTHLLAHGAVDARVGDAAFPLGQEQVLLGEGAERAALQGIILRVLYAGFNLPFVLRSRRLRRQHDRAVMLGKARHPRIEVRIEPVGVEDRRLEASTMVVRVTPPKCRNAFSTHRMNVSVSCRHTTSL